MTDISGVGHRSFDAFRMCLNTPYVPKHDIPVHIGLNPNNVNPYILYNTEQLSRGYMLNKILQIIKTYPPKEIWDYSLANCNILKANNIIAQHVPLRSNDFYIQKCKKWRAIGIKYDIGFCGFLSYRRSNIINRLINKGVSVNIITKFGEERDKELAQCKLHLNIHFRKNYKIFESARCELWLNVGVPIISENSLDNDKRCINVDYKDIVNTAIHELKK